jgi:hypothetical protein
MGIDYSSVGGVGIRLNNLSLVCEKIFEYNNEINEDEGYASWDMIYEEFQDSPVIPGCGGNRMCDDDGPHFLFVDAKKYTELKDAIPKFLEHLKKYDLEYNEDDLEIISDHIIS